MKKHKIVIVAATRTPMGSFMGSLSAISAPELGAFAIKEILQKTKLDPKLIDEVFMGNVLSAGLGQAPARQAALKASITSSTPCTTVNKVCSSGLKAIMLGAQTIALGDAQIIIAGGMENMSQVPHYAPIRNGKKYGNLDLEDGLQKDGLTDAYKLQAMGNFGDSCATAYAISREEQDNYAIQSYQKAALAWKNGWFTPEITPVSIPQRNGNTITISEDEEYTNVNLDKIPTLRPAFNPNGTVTAANASTLSDGAAAILLMSEEKALELNLTPIAYITSYADAAQDPELFTTSPALALQKALDKSNYTIADIDCFEINEAFSVVSLVNAKIMGIDPEKLNIFGGAVALGHPLGCSGARILVTLLNVLQQKNAKMGAAAICNGGGGASAIIVERVI